MKNLDQPELDATDFRRVVELGMREGLITRSQNIDVVCMIQDKYGNLKTAHGIVDGFQMLQQSEA